MRCQKVEFVRPIAIAPGACSIGPSLEFRHRISGFDLFAAPHQARIAKVGGLIGDQWIFLVVRTDNGCVVLACQFDKLRADKTLIANFESMAQR